MERERWAELSAAVDRVDAGWREGSGRFVHRTAVVVRVHLWAALHDRPVSWACDPGNWDPRLRPAVLPGRSTASRRTPGAHGKRFHAFLAAAGAEMSREGPGAPARLVKCMDGRALPVAAHSKGRDARWGRGAGQQSNGYKLHAVTAGRPMPEAWALTPLDVDERVAARRMIPRLGGCGYLLRDAVYDASDLHDRAAAANHVMPGPRRRPGTGLGHCYQSPHRLRCIDAMEPPAGVNDFGPSLYRRRAAVERDFGNLAGFGGGMSHLPPWARRIWRVRNWVHCKLLINAARIRCLRRRRGRA